MRRMISVAALVAVLVLPTLALACQLDTMDAQGDRFAAQIVTEPAPIPLNAPFSLIVSICPIHGGTPPSGVSLDASMPMHGHGMNYRPTITQLNDGRWRAEGFLFHMPGAWRIVIDVESEGIVDRLTLDRTVP